ncbi:MAG: DUF3467 domain-containing protein [Deltaproteobacteria bacterium]|nr:DUF3467 domain-containing protein [bacterium]MCB9475678.1 DUF3467 domain-containing protein [Deltaproteobacteria bacterium]MCB9479201.1 DUF3467 domain-containing protein [Deltaproteobacteria bacterium]MCB9490391.1 DUF3467 domain-containing protein [Deltaproteobacteria bacterium]
MADEERKPPRTKTIKLELKVDPDKAGGEYANICMVNHSDSEFVIDTFFLQPGRPQAGMKHRVIMAPKNAKRLMLSLADQVKRYEDRFGPIDVGKPGPSVDVVH